MTDLSGIWTATVAMMKVRMEKIVSFITVRLEVFCGVVNLAIASSKRIVWYCGDCKVGRQVFRCPFLCIFLSSCE